MGTMLTFMSSVVFRRETGCAGLANHETLFPHSLMFLTAIAREKGCYFLSQECLAVRANESVGYDLIQAFVTDFLAVMQYAEQIGYAQNAIRTVLSAHAQWLAGAIYHFKRTSYRPNLQKRLRDTLKASAVWWRDPWALLRVGTALWLPFPLLGRLKTQLKSGGGFARLGFRD